MSLNNNTYATKKTIAQVKLIPLPQFCTLPFCDLFFFFNFQTGYAWHCPSHCECIPAEVHPSGIFNCLFLETKSVMLLFHLRLALKTMTSTHQCWSCLYPACHSRWISTPALRISFDDILLCNYCVIFKILLKYRYRIFFWKYHTILKMRYALWIAFNLPLKLRSLDFLHL